MWMSGRDYRLVMLARGGQKKSPGTGPGD